MTRQSQRLTRIVVTILALITSLAFVGTAMAQCPGSTFTGGLQLPSKIIQGAKGNLIVAESGTFAPNSGRVSTVDAQGTRRTLVDGLPSGLNEIGDISGTSGLYLQGRTLYIVNGEGDATLAGPIPGTEVPNPAPSSPILSSVIALHFSNEVEKTTSGFTLSLADHQALKNGDKLKLNNGKGDKITIELIADFPDYTADPLPFFPPNVRHSNPYGVAQIGNNLFVSDGGQNAVYTVDIHSGSISTLTTFPPLINPLFPGFGGPFIEAVPDSIRESDGQLLVTLLRGFPFLPGNASVMKVNPTTGATTPLITGLTSAIDVLSVKEKGRTSHLTLEISTNLLAGDPGRLQRFETPAGPGTVISNCLISPSSMVRDKDNLYVTEIFTGRIIKIPGQ
ncbi:MAG: ScyD/ScyE family protein [Acidobacteriota bacterium]